MNALNTVAEFYGVDWRGVVEADLIFPSEEWINALHQGKCMIIEDTSIYSDLNPAEYENYKNLDIDSLIAYPFWKNPAGFLIVLNPKKT